MKFGRVTFIVMTLLFGNVAAAQTESPRAAFEHAMTQVRQSAKGSVAEQQAMERAIAAANRLSPRPAAPDAVLDLVGRAKAAARAATSPRDFLDAADAFGEAARLAPWVPEHHFNRSVVLEKAESYDQAERALALYLKAAPQAKDRNEVRERIAGLKYLKEKATRDKTDTAAAPRQGTAGSPPNYQKLAGRWRTSFINGGRSSPIRGDGDTRTPGAAEIDVIGERITITMFGGGEARFVGTIRNDAITGTLTNRDGSGCEGNYSIPFEGKVSPTMDWLMVYSNQFPLLNSDLRTCRAGQRYLGFELTR